MSNTAFLPRTIGIELVRGCNFECGMCPVTSNAPSETERFQFIDLALLEQLTNELEHWPSVGTIWFFHFGEPMAHPRYRQCLELLNRSVIARRALVIQHTNASLLKGDKAEAILEIPIINKLVFSFDGFGDRQSFELLRGPHFEVVLSNIRRFAEQAKQRRPDLMLATCTILPRAGEVPGLNTPERETALRQLHQLFDPLGIAVETRDMHAYSGNDQLAFAGKERAHVFGGCSFVEMDSLYFTVNGWAQPCCAVYNEAFRIGQAGKQDFGELLNNENMNKLRRVLRLDQRSENSFCNNCKLSLGGFLEPVGLESFWKTRAEQGLLEDPEERHHVFESVLPSSRSLFDGKEMKTQK